MTGNAPEVNRKVSDPPSRLDSGQTWTVVKRGQWSRVDSGQGWTGVKGGNNTGTVLLTSVV